MTRPILKLYTQDMCHFCHVMKDKLDSWGIKYEEVNVKDNTEVKAFLKSQGIKTVPQLFIGDFQVNKNVDTESFTERDFYDRLDDLIEEKDDIDQFMFKVENRIEEIDRIIDESRLLQYSLYLSKSWIYPNRINIRSRKFTSVEVEHDIELADLNEDEIRYAQSQGIEMKS